HNYLRNGGHADQIGTDSFQIANFGGSFKARTGKRGVDSFVNAKAEAFRLAQSDFAIQLEVSVAHIRKARAEALVIRSDQRIFSLQINVVANHNQPALAVIKIDRAGGVGEDGRADANASEDAHRKNHFPARISFIEMNAALHRGDRNLAGFSDREPAGMPWNGRARESRNFLVRDSRGGIQFVGERAEARAENQRNFRPQFRFRKNKFRGARGARKFVRAAGGFRMSSVHRSMIPNSLFLFGASALVTFFISSISTRPAVSGFSLSGTSANTNGQTPEPKNQKRHSLNSRRRDERRRNLAMIRVRLSQNLRLVEREVYSIFHYNSAGDYNRSHIVRVERVDKLRVDVVHRRGMRGASADEDQVGLLARLERTDLTIEMQRSRTADGGHFNHLPGRKRARV